MIDLTTSLWVALMTIVALFTLIPSKLELGRRAVLMACLAGIGILSYRSINARAGQPTPIPIFAIQETLVLGFYPEKETNQMYVWIKREGETIPKTFVLAFDEKTLGQLMALRSAHGGKPFYVNMGTFRKGFGRLVDGEGTGIEIQDTLRLPPKEGQ